jgi:hypothetical protein
MAKGTHIEERGKRSDTTGAARQHAYLEVATALNTAVYKNDFANDISKKEVVKMIDRVLEERKGVVGRGGYMERATRGRITRGLKRLWERPTKFDYDGSLIEWKLWRKAKEMENENIADRDSLDEDAAAEAEQEIENGKDYHGQGIFFLPVNTWNRLLTDSRNTQDYKDRVCN